MTIELLVVPVTAFQQNCSILVCGTTRKAAVFDPGGDLERIEQALTRCNATLEKVFLTHGHIDHCGESMRFAQGHGVPLEGPHHDDKFWIDQLPTQGQMFGFARLESFTPDRWLHDGATVQFGAQVLEVLHCPGHTPGHVVFFHRASQLAIVGDVLFDGSIGRTDFPRGKHEDLIASIRTKLFPLGDDVQFVPGHGPMSNFGEQRRINPYVSDALFAQG